jgi:pyrimidine-nucleoside phosphorylase
LLVAETIRAKRDGHALPPDEIREVLRAYTAGEVPDYQMAALLMAVYFRGLDDRELAAWAGAMLHSGTVVDLSGVPGAKVDKHSTGGVGDKVSIPLAPLVAACGVRVPMISGRGLGHTGGTLDKLEAIPGFRTDLPVARFVEGVATVGTCMIGQTDDLAPADRKLYALRDVTGTVESIPLIAASIMSKKLAEGIGGLVLDVKVGTGAFMKTPERARELARTLVAIGEGNGVRTLAFLTDMGQPLGRTVGNALEIEESIDILKGRGPEDTTALVVTLGGAMLWLGGAAAGRPEGEAAIRAAIASGAGLDRFRRMVAFQGGDPRVADEPDRLPRARSRKDVLAGRDGFVGAVDCEKVGLAALVLGGGRRRKDDDVDPAVGLRIRARRGDRVAAKAPLVTIEFDDAAALGEAEALVAAAYRVVDDPPATSPLVLEVVGG